MIPEFAHALAASKRAKKLMSEADRLAVEAEACSRNRGADIHDARRRIESVGDALAAIQAAEAATTVASNAMLLAFDKWKLIR